MNENFEDGIYRYEAITESHGMLFCGFSVIASQLTARNLSQCQNLASFAGYYYGQDDVTLPTDMIHDNAIFIDVSIQKAHRATHVRFEK